MRPSGVSARRDGWRPARTRPPRRNSWVRPGLPPPAWTADCVNLIALTDLVDPSSRIASVIHCRWEGGMPRPAQRVALAVTALFAHVVVTAEARADGLPVLGVDVGSVGVVAP